jgi:hypothetical protein
MYLGYLVVVMGEITFIWNWTRNRPFVHSPYGVGVNMGQRWNDVFRRKPKDSKINMFTCQSVRHKSHMN